MNRRAFLKRSAAIVATSAVGTVGYTIGIEPHWLEIVTRDLPIVDLPQELRGATLAQVSDIHVGPRVSDEYIVKSFDRLRAHRPDIVVFTGDFITHRIARGESQFAQLRAVLGYFPHGR